MLRVAAGRVPSGELPTERPPSSLPPAAYPRVPSLVAVDQLGNTIIPLSHSAQPQSALPRRDIRSAFLPLAPLGSPPQARRRALVLVQ
jgi:hypothetical protein